MLYCLHFKSISSFAVWTNSRAGYAHAVRIKLSYTYIVSENQLLCLAGNTFTMARITTSIILDNRTTI